jgi:hypothetical protein
MVARWLLNSTKLYNLCSRCVLDPPGIWKDRYQFLLGSHFSPLTGGLLVLLTCLPIQANQYFEPRFYPSVYFAILCVEFFLLWSFFGGGGGREAGV